MVTETVLYLEKGRKVRPFEGKTEFLPVDFVDLLGLRYGHVYSKQSSVLTTNVEFEGVKGRVSLNASSRLGTEHAQTPLGEVKTEIEFNNGIVVVRQIPLYLRLDFELHSKADWQKLSNNQAIFELDSNRYILQYQLQRSGINIEDITRKLEDYEIMPALGDSLLDAKTYKPSQVLLPYNLNRLSEGINLTLGNT